MKSLLILFRKFLILDRKTKSEYIKAYILTGFFRAYILFMPFKRLSKKMGKYNEESPEMVNEAIVIEAKRIADIVSKVSKYTLWESLCLVQALATQKMLYSEGILTTIYLGVAKAENKMLAHAWTRCGSNYITGGKYRNKFTVVAKFTN